MPQTIDQVDAVWVAGDSAVIGRLQPQPYDRRVVLAAINGPRSSTLTVYRGYALNPAMRLSRVFPADSRTYDSTMDDAPMMIRAGEAATFAWTGGQSGTGQTASATVTSQWGRD